MKPSSKQWIYAGLALVAGIGVVKLIGGPRIRRGMRVLLVGDSLAVGMAPYFGALAKEAGVEFKSLATVSTRIDQWASSAELAKLLTSFQPDMVLISLGTNDSYMTGGASTVEKQRAALEKLYALLTQWPRSSGTGRGPEHVVWIGPPTLPKPNPAMTGMIQDAAGNALSPRFHYFHSDRLSLPRGPDGLHPTARGYAGWAGAIWHWLS